MKQILVRYRISLLLKIFATFLFLNVVWAYDPQLPVDETTAQWYWMAQTGALYAVILLIATALHPGKKWRFPEYYYIITRTLLVLTAVEAVWGLIQFGMLKEISGSFPTSRLFGGYLAVMFPIGLNEWLGVERRRSEKVIQNLKSYLLLATCALIAVSVLITGFLLAWFVLLITSLFVMWYRFDWKEKVVYIWKTQRRKATYYTVAGLMVLFVFTVVLFVTNERAVKEHFFITKITFKAIAEKPLSGYGPAKFAYAYGEAQEQYFADDMYLPDEEKLAGSPEYPQNEYLYTTVEWGIPVVLCVLVFIGLSMYMGIADKRIGASASMLGVLVFSLFSYPMQIPAFAVTFLFLIMACIMRFSQVWLLGLAFIVGLFSVHWWKTDNYDKTKEWLRYQRLFYIESYDAARAGYDKLYNNLRDNPDFMYEYGYCLHKLNQYEASNAILKEAVHLSNDPEIYDLMGRNYQFQGRYEEAEKCYLKSANMVPERIFPFYLLTKLYNTPGYYHQQKSVEMARETLMRGEHNESLIVQYMREEARKLLESFRFD